MNLTIQPYDYYNHNNRNISFQRLDGGMPKLVKESCRSAINEYVESCTKSGAEANKEVIQNMQLTANNILENMRKLAKRLHPDIVFKHQKGNGQHEFVLTHEYGKPIKFKLDTSSKSTYCPNADEIALVQFGTIYHNVKNLDLKIPSLEDLEKFTAGLESINPKYVHESMLWRMTCNIGDKIKNNEKPEIIEKEKQAILKFMEDTNLMKDKLGFNYTIERSYSERLPEVPIDPKLAETNKNIAKACLGGWRIGTKPNK